MIGATAYELDYGGKRVEFQNSVTREIGVGCGRTMSFKMRAKSTTATGPWTTTETITTKACDDPPTPRIQSLSATDMDSVTITWNLAPPDPVASFGIWYASRGMKAADVVPSSQFTQIFPRDADQPDGYVLLRTVQDVGSQSITETAKLVCGETYAFRIRAKGDGKWHTAGHGDASDSMSVTMPDCPPAPEPDAWGACQWLAEVKPYDEYGYTNVRAARTPDYVYHTGRALVYYDLWTFTASVFGAGVVASYVGPNEMSAGACIVPAAVSVSTAPAVMTVGGRVYGESDDEFSGSITCGRVTPKKSCIWRGGNDADLESGSRSLGGNFYVEGTHITTSGGQTVRFSSTGGYNGRGFVYPPN